MKQYCRYCSHCFLQDYDYVYCEEKNQMKEKKNCSTINKCKHFTFNSMDVFDCEKEYKPREAYKSKRMQKIEAGQIEFKED